MEKMRYKCNLLSLVVVVVVVVVVYPHSTLNGTPTCSSHRGTA